MMISRANSRDVQFAGSGGKRRVAKQPKNRIKS
jgi:hypothetical protein